MKPLLIAAGMIVSFAIGSQAAEFRVLTLNVETDASDGRLPGIVELIRRSGADVVGLQEWSKDVDPNSAKVVGSDAAKAVNFHYRKLGGDTAILSRFPIDASPYPSHSAVITLENGRKVTVFDLHLFYKPYQPFQLLGIPYENGRFIHTEEEAIDEARKARGDDVNAALAELSGVKTPVVLMGDFNEPSYLDWTQAAASVHRHPIKVQWPATFAFAKAGLKDAFRVVYPDEMAKPGYTWTPTTRPDDPKDHHDRIDFILFRGGVNVRSVQIAGESAENADIVISPYPSDHRGVVATFDY